MYRPYHFIAPFLFVSIVLTGQSMLTEHTLKLDDRSNMQAASMEDMAWLAGRWTGTGSMGEIEETWNPPAGGSMNGTFRLIRNGAPVFYEMLLLRPAGKSLAYQVKHFDPDFSGWEEKNDYQSFGLIKIEGNRYYFDGLTIEREGDKCIHYIAIENENGKTEEAAFFYTRTPVPYSGDQVFPPVTRIPVLLLGSYHMNNPGLDQFNLKADDVLSAGRQREIEEVVNKLAAFRPTKICIEAPFMDSAKIARYKAYRSGKIPLSRSESEQIGFRLASQLDHETIYPIDVRMGMAFDSVESLVAANPVQHGPQMEALEKMGNEAMQIMDKWLREGSVREMLYKMNSPQFLDLAYQLYLQIFLPMVEGENYAGANLVAKWFHRNLLIMSNLHQLDLTPEDRILIIYGQGHIPVFERIAEDSPYFEVVDVLPFLR